ncbi:hypothetical protein Pla175_00280 [Pirellulimonas nuda]|uniref:4Fe-4S ferredoxin-type domain-containing protein n=1 Tax=Pirellulimonas nuda TaxID=2528009 RepID=A0A518D5D3_9BACT|nr:putative zinc-binding metallopeptidase [Pirellulimonas nuda]QDU86678.1 hypothetical protein Pla175_00280 [Pirellulimonas nuda]
MKSFDCTCGNALFLDSTRCVGCGKQTIMCPLCSQLRPLDDAEATTHRCANQACGAELRLCDNYTQHQVCNRGVADDADPLCDYCRMNDFIPDLSVEGNPEKWSRMERAKRRVLYGVQQVGLPIPQPGRPLPLALKFNFMADGAKRVTTGHADGVITINLHEADSVEREKRRVEFNEPARTLVGHFRHELGHYYWQLLVEPTKDGPNSIDVCRQLFGDERDPTYADAQKKYYAQGPAPDWRTRCISAYATMHPWEDFAETFAAYLDMAAIMETVTHYRPVEVDLNDFDAMLNAFHPIGVFSNELNRDQGLLDLVPEVFSPPVVEKLRFIHGMRGMAPVISGDPEAAEADNQVPATPPVTAASERS